jgi:phage terminase small subunit
MAGVKGRSGGARPNTGGARPGAGRPKKETPPPIPVESEGKDMLTLLQDIALGKIEVTNIQLRAAVAAVQYTHAKIGEGGKKERKQEEAKKVAGRFSAAEPPRLVASGGKPV